MTTFDELEIVALARDVDEHDLKSGDAGTIVEVLAQDAFIVEFTEVSGDTRAILTLKATDLRKLGPGDILAARSTSHA